MGAVIQATTRSIQNAGDIPWCSTKPGEWITQLKLRGLSMPSLEGGYLDVQATYSFILFAECILYFTSTQPRSSLLCAFNRCSQLTQGRLKGVIPGYSAQLLFLSQLGPSSIDFIYSDSGRGQLRDTENRPFLLSQDQAKRV